MQGKKIFLITVSGLAALAVNSSAFAIMSVPNGWYLEGNLGSTHLSNKKYEGNSSSSGLGGNANLGYKFMPFFALEFGYTQYANTSVTDPSTSTKAGQDKHYSYDLAARGILPVVDSGFEAFAKVGVQRINSHITITNAKAANDIGLSNSSHSTTGLYYGLGGQYYFMPELAFVVQWQRAQGTTSTGTLDLFTGGISFIFD